MSTDYPRDLIGYGAHRPHAKWPGGARVAVQFVINYEEGGENCVLHGDKASEAFLSEIVGAQPYDNMRHMNMESIYEYGSRAGFWRLHRIFTDRQVPVTVFGVASAMERNPVVVDAMLCADWEIASHGYRWIDYQFVSETVEREHLQRAVAIHERLTQVDLAAVEARADGVLGQPRADRGRHLERRRARRHLLLAAIGKCECDLFRHGQFHRSTTRSLASLWF